MESPHCRRSKGKSVTGEIFIKLRPSEENLVIEVWDDGQGLNIEKIRRKMNPSSAALTSKDLAHAIFQSGFLTKNQVNHVSGRGIGMDAVRNSLESHGASIHIKLRPEDYGCDQFTVFSFVIAIPRGYFVIQQD
ncbi:ATP-binding protein [Pseudobacteriovorax antillogorgiicola]|uniref:ATP-binding protein n=1 Tax=Pseudobacteriovorax antillogorgiicola TaxID=1513793 RepID=UPI001F238441|nr:ATP-binding protein [Pseudobacteriovorax antillogorgiicola]